MKSDNIKWILAMNTATFGVVSWAATEAFLKIVLLLLTIALTARKWWIVEKKAGQKKDRDTDFFKD